MSGLFDVITVGSNTLDVFVKTTAELLKVTIHENGHHKKETCLVYPLGAKILINDLNFEIGGGGTNTAVSFSRLGLKTGYLGKIGKDNAGIQVFNLLHKENIEFLGSFGDKTGYSVILDSDAKDRTILTFKGCNNDFKFKEIDLKKIKTNCFYFSSMAGTSLQVLEKLAFFANKTKTKIVFNPSRYLVLKGKTSLKKILVHTNVLVLNKNEAELLSGKKGIENSMLDLKKIIKDYVIITDGKNGCWCFDGLNLLHLEARKNIKIVETTGAGDAFASAFTAGLIMGKDLKSSLKMGIIQAESVIQYSGAKNLLLSKRNMLIALKKDKRLIIEKKL
ncbi:MAG: carbohydrate kinase family protein [Candidatus Woesearchaeota archaeon]